MRLSVVSRSVVQRYTRIPLTAQRLNNWQGLGADLRVSDDGNMAVKDTPVTPQGTTQFQDFYATPALIQRMQGTLNHLNSGFTVAQGVNTLTGPSPDGSGNRTLYEVVITNLELNNRTFENCNANMWHLMGVYRNNAWPRTPYTRFASSVSGQLEIASKDDTGAGMKALRSQMTGATTTAEARRSYEQMWNRVKDWKSWWYGINQYALPEMGEGIGIFTAGTSGQSGGAHFAGVISKSGHDNVMLENYAGNPGGGPNGLGVPGLANPNWYVRMFGPVKKYWLAPTEDQTFYGEHLRLNEYGQAPMVVRVTSQ
jgi:hypothetical protein